MEGGAADIVKIPNVLEAENFSPPINRRKQQQ